MYYLVDSYDIIKIHTCNVVGVRTSCEPWDGVDAQVSAFRELTSVTKTLTWGLSCASIRIALEGMKLYAGWDGTRLKNAAQLVCQTDRN